MPRLDEEGYLVEPAEWSESLAEYFAQQENITLTDVDWGVIRFNEEHQIAPDARHVIKHLSARLGADARCRAHRDYVGSARKIKQHIWDRYLQILPRPMTCRWSGFCWPPS